MPEDTATPAADSRGAVRERTTADRRARLLTRARRRREVARLLLARRPIRAIAAELGVSLKTVNADTSAIRVEWQAAMHADFATLRAQEAAALNADEDLWRTKLTATLAADDILGALRIYDRIATIWERRVRLLRLHMPPDPQAAWIAELDAMLLRAEQEAEAARAALPPAATGLPNQWVETPAEPSAS